MKSTVSRFSTLNRRAEYLKLRAEKEKEKKGEVNEEEEIDEEEDDALDEKNNQNFQKTKNIPISTTPLSQKIPLNRLNEKQKLTATTTQIPYKFTKLRMNYTSPNNKEMNLKNPKDILIMRQGLKEKNYETTDLENRNNIIKNSTNVLKQTPNSPKGIKSGSILQNNPPKILKATYSHTNLNSHNSGFGSKYSSIRKFGETITKQEENKNEIKIINKNNNYTINVTNNNNTITVNNSNNNNFININNKKNENEAEEKNEEEIKEEENKEFNKQLKSKKEPRKDIKEKNLSFNNKSEINNNDIYNVKKNESKKEENEIKKEEEIEEEINPKKKEKEEEVNSKDIKRTEYASNELMIKNGIEIVKFSEEETNKIMEQKAENIEKKKIKKQKKEKYKNNTISEKGKDSFKFHKRETNNYVERGHYNNLTSHNKKYENRNNEYDDNFQNNKRGTYNHFYERGRPNPVFRGSRGRGGKYRY